MAYVFYIAAVCGAMGVYLVMPHRRSLPILGALIALASLAGMLGWVGAWAARHEAGSLPGVYYYLFTAISVIAAVRVIVHPRPVYSALYFILVILSSAGMLVLLDAEFMAFAMVIIYAGAILVTYMFVIMLATMPQSAQEPETSALYDRQAREPLWAVFTGFAMLAVLGGLIFDPHDHRPPSHGASLAQSLKEIDKKADLTDVRQKRHIEAALRELGRIEQDEEVYGLDFEGQRIDVRLASGTRPRYIALDSAALSAIVPNTDQVGLNLFKGHTLGIELAAVILLLAMVGAIVIAKRAVPEGETSHG